MSLVRLPILRALWWLMAAATAVGALAWLWIAWCEFPLYGWNDVRLAPSFALRDGLNPYPLMGDGPVTTWIYGPVALLVNLPATFADSLRGALHSASLVNALTVLAPMGLIFFSSAELRARGVTVCMFAFALSVLLVPTPNLILQVADHSAVAFGLLSIWCLARTRVSTAPELALTAGSAALAVWSKQIAIFLPVAHLAYLLWTRQRASVRLYLMWYALFNLAALAGFCRLFGFENLWLNMVEIPARLGWANFGSRIAQRMWPLLAQVILPTVALVIMWRFRRWPALDSHSGRFFHLGVFAYGAMLPIGLFAFLKVGGDTNLLHSWAYLMPAALLLWLARDRGLAKDLAWRLAAAALALMIHRRDFRSVPVRPYTQQLDTAAVLTARYPRTIWFPQNPLITYFAHNKLWHSEDGVSTRFLAGYALREAEFRKHLPPDLQAVAYPSVNNSPFSMRLLGDLSVKQRVPYWSVYMRPAKKDLDSTAAKDASVAFSRNSSED